MLNQVTDCCANTGKSVSAFGCQWMMIAGSEFGLASCYPTFMFGYLVLQVFGNISSQK